ncbi:glycosyltransferase [Leuconostoc holzapfelii]|uniref:Glycosyltransferase n=1 Tax=Leuconostoc holzapfelii TaxID=434464 RepID=A0ABT2NT17_9LACO|nr:glycosyltransferase [Leuconostoc holzapfelii]MCT8388496.1 glycosyltransferase [Leuconostoc holzapfelii]
MKILHYGLGFPPERSGGLVKYSFSLMKEQMRKGHDVLFVYPGHLDPFRRNPYFKTGNRDSIQFAELINALPLPLIGNIKNHDAFMVPANIGVFSEFLMREKPDVIHLHTLMGLYSEFLTAANDLNIKVVFTTHDFFGISPNPKFYLDGHDFADDPTYDIWNNIREYGSSTQKLRLVQLSIYPRLRHVIKKIKKPVVSNTDYVERTDWNLSNDVDFQKLKEYYLGMLQNVNIIHFNSQISKQVYHRFLPRMSWKEYVIPITSDHIKQSAEIHLTQNEIRTIAYIGPYTQEKGFFNFIKIASGFLKADSNHRAVVMGDDASISFQNIVNFGRYDQAKMTQLLKNIDLVILPSQWHETFGLIAVEVLKTGTKVMVSAEMGASEILPDELILKTKKTTLNWNDVGNFMGNIKLVSARENYQEVTDLY